MKRILALVLTLVMLFTMASCNLFAGPTVQETITESTSPEATNPEVTTTPEVTTVPEETTAPSEETTPQESIPEDEGPTFPSFETTLPETSKVIANIIGAIAASVEVSKDSQFVVVLEQDDEYSETDGYKQVLFFEVAEASVDSDGELLKANLAVKIGEAVVTLSENISAADIVVSKEDITSYYEFSVVVNGDNVLVSVDDQNATQNLSELVYTAIAQMMGVESVEALEEMFAQAQQNAFLAQELQNKVLPMIEAALSGAIQELPTVSPEYVEHLAQLFETLGTEIFAPTTDDETGYTTYSINVAALKNLLSEIDGKTLAEYFESVYGETAAEALSSFLKALPDKKVKDIVDSAVALAEATGSDIKDIYALIDMYIYSVTGAEFSIEEQINTRYNNTLIELLAELNGVSEDDAAFAGIKSLFTDAADVFETVSVDALLSSMFMGTEEGFIDALEALIDQLDEAVVYNVTFDAEGYVVAINYGIGEIQYSLINNGEATIITISLPSDVEIILSNENETPKLIINQGGEQIAIGEVFFSEKAVGENTISTIEFDFHFGEDDLLDAIIEGTRIGEADSHIDTKFDIIIRGYRNESEYYYNPETDESQMIYSEEVVDVITLTYVKDIDGLGNSLGYTFNATVNVKDATVMGDKNNETGEYYEVYTEEYYELFEVECSKSVEGTFIFDLLLGETVGVQFTQEDNEMNVTITSGEETVASGSVSVTDEIIGEDEVSTIVMDLRDSKNDLLDYTAVMVNGVITERNIVIRGTYVEEEWVERPMTDEELEEYYNNLFGIGGKTEGDEYITVNPENGFITIVPPSQNGPTYVESIVAPMKGEWVTTETFVELLNVQFRSYDDKSVWTISAYENIMLGANNVTITVSANQISAVLEQDDEFVAEATLYTTESGLHFDLTDANGSNGNAGFEFINGEDGESGICIYWCGEEYKFAWVAIENGLKVTLTENAVLEITSTSANELVIDIDLSEFYLYDYGTSCYIEFDGSIIIKVA